LKHAPRPSYTFVVERDTCPVSLSFFGHLAFGSPVTPGLSRDFPPPSRSVQRSREFLSMRLFFLLDLQTPRSAVPFRCPPPPLPDPRETFPLLARLALIENFFPRWDENYGFAIFFFFSLQVVRAPQAPISLDTLHSYLVSPPLHNLHGLPFFLLPL